MAANITYLGEPGTDERSEPLHWRSLDFEIGKAVLVDPEAATSNGERIFYEHVLLKTKNNPHFTVEDVEPEAPARRRVKGRDDEDDGEDEPANGDYDLSTLPKDWREMHHKKVIALARRLGGEGEALATRDGAISYIEEQLALGVLQQPAEFSL